MDLALERKQKTSRHLQEMKEAASRAESDTRAIRVELASYEKQVFIQQEINAQITLQKELANHLLNWKNMKPNWLNAPRK